MSNTFIGLTMLVTLNSPPGAQLRGVVSGIEPGKSLTLKNVTCPANGKYVPEFMIHANEIVELVEAGSENVVPTNRPVLMATPVSQSSAFEDPAILSVGKRPTPVDSRPKLPQPWSGDDMKRGDSQRTANTSTRDERPYQDPVARAAAAMVESMQKMAVEEDDDNVDMGDGLIVDEPGEMGPDFAAVKGDGTTRQTRRERNQARKDGRRNPDKQVQEPAPGAPAPAKGTRRAKGWRQTPLLTESSSFQPFSTLTKKNGRRNRKMGENGWGTEDATDVQDMGDFDFEGGLAKFDKHTVFNQIQAEDSVADEDRLVYHNRLPKAKPGTAGGKNLHYTENVLDGPTNGGPPKNDAWKSEAGESGLEERDPRGSGSGRLSRRADSKLSTNRRPVSRKGSSTQNSGQPQRTTSIPIAPAKPSFFLVPSDRRCEPISALQMLNLENIADHDLGLSEDMMAENAGRGIAEVALSALNNGGGGLTQGKKTTLQNVVVLAGNNKSGLRAVAAARHIRNHGMHVIVCVLGLDREAELLAGLKRQIKVFRSFGGKILKVSELMDYLKTLDTPVELVIDSLLGLTIPFDEMRRSDQAAVFELMEWANRGKASVLAIDVPTGIDPTSGKVNVIEGRKLYLHAKYVVAMGAPQKGLLDAMALGEGVADEDGVAPSGEWQLFVADIGLGAAAWKKAGTKVRRGVEFEGSWVVGMRFQGGTE